MNVCSQLLSTLTSSSGLKTRHFRTIIRELTSCLRIHTECGSKLGGVSLEFTGEFNDEGFSVTECIGGSMELSEEELGLRYQVVHERRLHYVTSLTVLQSFCDPRLNFEQSLGEHVIAADLDNHQPSLNFRRRVSHHRSLQNTGAGTNEGTQSVGQIGPLSH